MAKLPELSNLLSRASIPPRGSRSTTGLGASKRAQTLDFYELASGLGAPGGVLVEVSDEERVLRRPRGRRTGAALDGQKQRGPLGLPEHGEPVDLRPRAGVVGAAELLVHGGEAGHLRLLLGAPEADRAHHLP